MASLDLAVERRRNRVSAGPSAPFDSGTGLNVIPPTQASVPAPSGPRVDGSQFPGMPGNPPRAPQAGVTLPSGVSQDQFSQLAQRAGGEQQARDWLTANPGDIQRGLTTATFDSGGGGAQGLFDDPATSQLEGHLNQQIAKLQQPNPQLNQLLEFLNTQFQQHAQNPGYSPEELAVLRTQAFEPQEAYRQASKQRAIERAGARGMLPSSGLHELDMRDIDLAADRNRTALDRDLAINQIGERNADIGRALNFATQGFQVPTAYERQTLNDILARSQQLYNLPRQAMLDANMVVGGSQMPGNLFQQALQLISAQENQSRYNQQRDDAYWAQLGASLADLFI